MTAPPYPWKHDDMNKWREMQFTFGADEDRFQEPIEGLAFSLDNEAATAPFQSRTYNSILTACTKELQAFQEEQPIPWSDEVDAGFRRLGRPSSRNFTTTTTTTEATPKPALQLESDVNKSLYNDLRLMQSNQFYQTEYRRFVVTESKDSTAMVKEKAADTVNTQ
jgi:hypothetical protein